MRLLSEIFSGTIDPTPLFYDEEFQFVGYSDEFSKIRYYKLFTKDERLFNKYAIFTSKPNEDIFECQGQISNKYLFVGNKELVDSILETISDQPIFDQIYFLDGKLTHFENIVTLDNRQQITIGQGSEIIYPNIKISNTYDGSGKACVRFGFSLNGSKFSFSNKIMSVEKVHVFGSSTYIGNAITQYVGVFQGNIGEIIQHNYQRQIDEESVFDLLHMVREAVGKKRADDIKGLLPIGQGHEHRFWDIFKILVSYSSKIDNINVRAIYENALESAIEFPERVFSVVEQFNSSIQ